MGKWRRAFGLEEKEEEVVLAEEKEDIEILIEPDGTEKMTGHAEQHSALTRIQRDNVVKFAATEENITELEKDVNSYLDGLQDAGTETNEAMKNFQKALLKGLQNIPDFPNNN